MRFVLLILSALTLSACLSVDANVDIAEDGSVNSQMVLTVSQDMIELINVDGGQNFCIEDGEVLSQNDRGYACTTTREAHVRDLIDGNFSFDVDPSNSNAASTPLKVTEIETGVLEIIIDLSPMMEDDTQQTEMQSEEIKEMVKAAMEGHAMTYRFTGIEVLETTGQISPDGRTASLSVPMGDFIDKTAPASFRSVIRYQDAGILSMIISTLSALIDAIWPF